MQDRHQLDIASPVVHVMENLPSRRRLHHNLQEHSSCASRRARYLVGTVRSSTRPFGPAIEKKGYGLRGIEGHLVQLFWWLTFGLKGGSLPDIYEFASGNPL